MFFKLFFKYMKSFNRKGQSDIGTKSQMNFFLLNAEEHLKLPNLLLNWIFQRLFLCTANIVKVQVSSYLKLNLQAHLVREEHKDLPSTLKTTWSKITIKNSGKTRKSEAMFDGVQTLQQKEPGWVFPWRYENETSWAKLNFKQKLEIMLGICRFQGNGRWGKSRVANFLFSILVIFLFKVFLRWRAFSSEL